jgi:hypothetical protein
VVAAPMGPPGHRDDAADRGFADLTAVVSSHVSDAAPASRRFA